MLLKRANYNRNEDYLLDTWVSTCSSWTHFSRRGVALADVSVMAPTGKDDMFTLGEHKTYRFEDLSSVALSFEAVFPHSSRSQAILFRKRTLHLVVIESQLAPAVRLAKLAAASISCPVGVMSLKPLVSTTVQSVVPAAACQHMEKTGHITRPRGDKSQQIAVLDLPLPVPVRITPHRCSQCQHSQSGSNAYFKVSVADLRVAFPGVMLHDSGWHGRVY